MNASRVGESMEKRGKIIHLDIPTRRIQKAREYLSDMELFLSDSEKAVTILLETLPHADVETILKMLPLIGYGGRDGALEPLYQLMTISDQDDQVRRAAAIQLALAASLSDEPSLLRKRLVEKIRHGDSSIRSCCVLALGWEGNLAAVKVLMMMLQDKDREVRVAAVTALSSIGDRRAFNALADRLKTGTIEEQRSILLNLWRFEAQTAQVENLYLDFIVHGLADLRLDALSALAMIPLSSVVLDAYRNLLVDEDPRIRYQTLANLSVLDPTDYRSLEEHLRLLLADCDARVRRAAVSLFARQ